MAMNKLMPWNWGEKRLAKQGEQADPFYQMQRNMNQAFQNFFSDFDLAPYGQQMEMFQPSIDVSENDDEIIVAAELPGMDENDIEVSLTRDMLTISGEKRHEKEDKGENTYYMERSYGSFQRSIPLSAEVDSDKVKATFKNGVLTVNLPKTAEARKQGKHIAVKHA